jgi:hypothetical protein
MTKFIPWKIGDPEPQPDELIQCESMDFSWKLPWKQIREDVLSGFTTAFRVEKEDD